MSEKAKSGKVKPGKNKTDKARSKGKGRGEATPEQPAIEALAKLHIDSSRDPMLLLHAADRERLPALLKIRRERMSASAFGFFRGAARVMAYDLSRGPHTGILCQMCGDAHVQNLGAYSGPDGRLIFDINDFDESMRGPFEWDLKRMTTSFLLAGRVAGVSRHAATDAAECFLRTYCDLMRRFAGMPVLEVARYQVHRLAGAAPVSRILKAAERSTPLMLRDKLTERTRKSRRFRNQPPLLRRLTGSAAHRVLKSLESYRSSLQPERLHILDQYSAVDVAFKVVGTGSVGLRDFCVYLEGNGPGDPLFLQIKQEEPSCYAPYLETKAVRNEGQRVVEAQRAMQLQSDPMLGWTTMDGRGYLVRQLNDHKASVAVEGLNQAGLAQYATVCGEMMARGHGRSGRPAEMAEYIGKGKRFRAAMLEFAAAYAEQTVRDWKRMTAENSRSRGVTAAK